MTAFSLSLSTDVPPAKIDILLKMSNQPRKPDGQWAKATTVSPVTAQFKDNVDHIKRTVDLVSKSLQRSQVQVAVGHIQSIGASVDALQVELERVNELFAENLSRIKCQVAEITSLKAAVAESEKEKEEMERWRQMNSNAKRAKGALGKLFEEWVHSDQDEELGQVG